jgi:undecaprenyl diphosphate synthase
MSDLEHLDPTRIPEHVAIIMDGNGRWAKKQGHLRIFGHKHGVSAVRNAVEFAGKVGIKYLTLYTFSTENWNRPKTEINALMQLLVDTIQKELPSLMKNGVKVKTLGNMDDLPSRCVRQLKETEEATKDNTRTTLILALSYSGRWDIIEAVKKVARDVESGSLKVDEITERTLDKALNTSDYPHPDLLIRTSGEMRISNFLLWEIAYSEIHFTNVLWPDFRREHFLEALKDYQSRERRFGKTSEQLKTSGGAA